MIYCIRQWIPYSTQYIFYDVVYGHFPGFAFETLRGAVLEQQCSTVCRVKMRCPGEWGRQWRVHVSQVYCGSDFPVFSPQLFICASISATFWAHSIFTHWKRNMTRNTTHHPQYISQHICYRVYVCVRTPGFERRC